MLAHLPLDSLEESVHSRPMHRNRTASARFSCGHPLLHRSDKLLPGRLPSVGYLTLVGCRHDRHDHSPFPRHAEPQASGLDISFAVGRRIGNVYLWSGTKMHRQQDPAPRKVKFAQGGPAHSSRWLVVPCSLKMCVFLISLARCDPSL